MSNLITVRLRSPNGMERLKVADSISLFELKSQWAQAHQSQPREVVVSESPSMDQMFIDEDSSLKELGIGHGAMLYIDGHRGISSRKGGQAATSHLESNTVSSATSSSLSRESKPAESDEISGAPKCNHASHVLCPNCLTEDEPMNTNRCNHPSTARCPNCLPAESPAEVRQREKEKAVIRQRELKRRQQEQAGERCQHPANGMCTLCAPSNTFKDELEFDARVKAANGDFAAIRPRCTRHGAHGSCVACESWVDSQRLHMKREERADLRFYLSASAGSTFTNLALSSSQPIAAILLGYTKDKKHKKKIFVEAIHELPCQEVGGSVYVREDPFAELVQDGAKWFGWRPVGWTFVSTAPEGLITSRELQQALALQPINAHHLPFVSLAVKSAGGGTARQLSYEAFTVSSQALKLHRQGLIVDQQTDVSALSLKSDVYLESTRSASVPVPFFLIPVRVFAWKDGIFRSGFLGLNRKPTLADLKAYFYQHAVPFLDKVRDFNVLLFLASNNYLDRVTDLPILCEQLMSPGNEDPTRIEGYKLILGAITEMEL